MIVRQLGIILFYIKYPGVEIPRGESGEFSIEVTEFLRNTDPTDFFKLGDKDFDISSSNVSHVMIWQCLQPCDDKKPLITDIRNSAFI